jgi:hypothetical protein
MKTSRFNEGQIIKAIKEQHVRPELDNLGLPSMISNLAKEKALKILSEGIQEKLLTNKS